MMTLDTNNHLVFALYYHLVLVIKYRKQAVETQLHIALITYCLLKIVHLRTSYTGSLLKIERLLRVCFHEPFSCFIKKLHKKPKHSSRDRPKEKHELVFKMLEWQVMENGTDHLDDLTYDPTIL